MAELPGCARPLAEDLEVLSAMASTDMVKVTVSFNRPLDTPTSQSTDNYTIEPGVIVNAAKLDENDNTIVRLEVSGLQSGTDYVLTVANVTSIDNRPLNPKHSSTDFSVN